MANERLKFDHIINRKKIIPTNFLLIVEYGNETFTIDDVA